MKFCRCHQIVLTLPISKNPLDIFPFRPIIGQNNKPMNPSLFALSLIVVVLIVVLILKDQFSVRMAAVRVK